MKQTRKVKRIRRIRVDAGLNKDMQEKLVILFIIVLLAFVGLSIRLVTITKDNGEKYKKQVLSQQRYESRTIPYKRGDILDCNGNQLATSEKVYNLIIDAKLMNSGENTVDETMKALRSCFAAYINESDLRKYVSDNPTSQYYVVERQLTYDQISKFLEMDANDEEYPDIRGVWFEEEYKRIYPNNELACDVIGFTGKDNVGNYGLEQFYNDTLNGVNGREYGYLNDEETLERTTKAAVDGYNIVTTIDANVQQIIEKYLFEFNEANKNQARDGNGANNLGCIVMDINTGEVLGMASYPNFDLNNTKDINRLIGSKKVEADGTILPDAVVLTAENINEELADDDVMYMNLNNLWKNFCITQTYEPGSTYKPFTVACGLESGKMTGEEFYTCNGQLQVADRYIKCHNYKKGGDGTLSVQQSVEQSCNVALMLMGRQIGKETFLDYQRKFNFGLKTNIDLYGEARTDSLVFNNDTMGETELATCTFGQGFNVTMIQMITGFSALVNGGYYYEPHVVKQITAADGSVVENISPRVLKQIVSAQTSQKIVQYCNGVVVNGTGKTARPAGYAIGGKTGTAETIPRDKTNYVLSFEAFAPADDPQIALYVVVDRPNAWGQDNVGFATRLCRSMLTEILPYLNYTMTEELSEKEEAELAELNITIKRPGDEEEAAEEEIVDVEIPVDENGNVDAHGGDTTSSVPVSEAEMASDSEDTAPLTGSVLNVETGEAIRQSNEESPY